MFTRTSWPGLVQSRLAPITAMDRGVSSRATDFASARCSRDSMTARERSVGSMSKWTMTTPSSKPRDSS